MEWLLIVLVIASLSMLQGDNGDRGEVAVVCVLASCVYTISEGTSQDSGAVVLSECEQELLDSSSCPTPTP